MIKTRSDHTIKLTDKNGNDTMIQQLPIDQPNVGLGCRLAPDGGKQHESCFREQQCQTIYAKLKPASLTTDEAYQYLLTRIVPSVCYASALTDILDKTCRKMNSIIDSVILPKLGVNRHMPKAVIYGPVSRGGLNYPQFKTIQTTRSITYMIKQLQWNKDIAKDIRISIETIQLMSGLEEPIMEYVDPPIKYIEKRGYLQLESA